MRKLMLLLFAAFLFTSCDNLKTKNSSKSEDDTEETTAKKKKKKIADEEDDSADEEVTPKKKKKSVDDDDEVVSNQDEEYQTTSSNEGWSNSDRKRWMNECVGTAEKNVGTERANDYCNCMLEKAEAKYASYSEANRKMTNTTINNWAADCNQ